MPVEHIQLVHLHQVQVVLDDVLGDEVPAGVEEDTAVGEPGAVPDLGQVEEQQLGLAVVRAGVDQLAETLQTSQDSPHCGGQDLRSASRGTELDLICNIECWRVLKQTGPLQNSDVADVRSLSSLSEWTTLF